MSGNDVNNAYLSILKSYQNIDQQYSGFTNNALLNSSIFGSTGASSSSSANKTAMWLGIASIAGSALTAGASIWGTIAMNKSMRQAASAAAQQTNTPTVDYKSKTADELTLAKSKLEGEIEVLKKDIDNLKIEQGQANDAKKDYAKKSDDYNSEYNKHNNNIAPLESSLAKAKSSLTTLSAKSEYKANAADEAYKANMRSEAEEAEFKKLSGKDTDEGSVKYIEAQIEKETKARDVAFKHKKEADEGFTTKTGEVQKISEKIQSKNTAIENKEAEIAKIKDEETRRAAEPKKTGKNNKKQGNS